MDKNNEKLLTEVDETIKAVGKKIRNEKFLVGEYSKTVMALAALLLARATLD